MITNLKEFSEKLDKVGKEDIDINNDGKVDKSDFFLLARRRKIKKAIKDKKNENVSSNNYSKAMQLFYDFNTLTTLMDEGYLNNDTLEFKEGLSLVDINAEIAEDGSDDTFEDIADYERFIERCKKHLAIE